MTNYYKDQQTAFMQLHTVLDRAKSNKENIDISYIVYEFAKTYPISGKSIRKQIELYAKSRNLSIKDDRVVMQ